MKNLILSFFPLSGEPFAKSQNSQSATLELYTENSCICCNVFYDFSPEPLKLKGTYKSGDTIQLVLMPHRIELRCNEAILEQIIDRFSESIHITDKSDGKFNFRTKALVSDGLVSWLMQFGGDIEVISPSSIRDMIKEKIEEVAKLY